MSASEVGKAYFVPKPSATSWFRLVASGAHHFVSVYVPVNWRRPCTVAVTTAVCYACVGACVAPLRRAPIVDLSSGKSQSALLMFPKFLWSDVFAFGLQDFGCDELGGVVGEFRQCPHTWCVLCDGQSFEPSCGRTRSVKVGLVKLLHA